MILLDLKDEKLEHDFWKPGQEAHPEKSEPHPLPQQLILFSKHHDMEVTQLERALKDHYDVVVHRSFRNMYRFLEQIGRTGKKTVALLIHSKADRDDLLYSDQKLSRLATQWPHLRQIALADRTPAVRERLGQLIRQGLIHDFHSLPVDRRRLLHCLGHIQGLVSLESAMPPPGCISSARGYGRLIGTSGPMQKIYSAIKRISQVNTPVLITGESGTGKEVIARTIHDDSPFRDGPFVAINCAALPAGLIESELFGHETGAFTGASARKIGKVELADRGTLFLDEIGDMPVDLQTRFLRFLQESSFARVGGLKEITIETRVIAATNVNLSAAIDGKRFREDLYYRLNVLSLHAPPLRNRCEDIRLLADDYLEKFKVMYEKPRLSFTGPAYELMNKYAWPGNVRELISAVRRAVILARTRFIQPENLGLACSLAEVRESGASLIEAREDFDRRFIHGTLARNSFNMSRAAEELQISRVSLYRLTKKLDISPREGGKILS